MSYPMRSQTPYSQYDASRATPTSSSTSARPALSSSQQGSSGGGLGFGLDPHLSKTSYPSSSSTNTGVVQASSPYPSRPSSSYPPAAAQQQSSNALPSGSGRGRGRLSRRGIFADKLPNLMYGAGDVPNPNPGTVAVMEEIMVDYFTDICLQAQPQLQPLQTNPRKVKVDDIRHALREKELYRQLGRVEELLAIQKEQKKLRQQFTDITED